MHTAITHVRYDLVAPRQKHTFFKGMLQDCLFAGNHRKLRVTSQPNLTLTLEHVPAHCRRAKTLLLGPLTPSDLDAAAFVHQEHGTHYFAVEHAAAGFTNCAGSKCSVELILAV